MDVTSSPRNLGLDEFRKLCERLLPAEIAHLERNGFRHPFLHYLELGAARHFLQVTVVCISPGKFGSSKLSV